MKVNTTGIHGMRLATVFIAIFMGVQVFSNLLSGLISTGILNFNTLVNYGIYYTAAYFPLIILDVILPIIAGIIILKNRKGFPNVQPKILWGSVLIIMVFPGSILQLIISGFLLSYPILVHQIALSQNSTLGISLPVSLLIPFLTTAIGTLLIGLVFLNKNGIKLLLISTGFYALLPILGFIVWAFSSYLGAPRSPWSSLLWYFFEGQFEVIIASILSAFSFFFFYKFSEGGGRFGGDQSKGSKKGDRMVVLEKEYDKSMGAP